MPEQSGFSAEAPNILDTISSIKDVLPKKQRHLCNYLLQHYESVGLTTVAELAERANVGTTTVMRLVKSLKYDTFNAFKKDLLSVVILRENSSYRSMKQAFGKTDVEHTRDNLTLLCEEAADSIRNIPTPRNAEQFERAVDFLLGARHIYILAQRSSKAAALCLEYSLSPFLPDKVRQISTELDYVYDKVLTMQKEDVLFIVSNWPCGSTVIEVARSCRERGIPIILLTNTNVNPISKLCDILLDTNSVNGSYLLLPAIAVIEALSAELGHRTLPQSTENLERLEDILREKKMMVW